MQEIINPRKVQPAGNFMVKLEQIWCNCGKFQKVHMSCSHVIAACKHVHHDYRAYIDPIYTLESVSNMYKANCAMKRIGHSVINHQYGLTKKC